MLFRSFLTLFCVSATLALQSQTVSIIGQTAGMPSGIAVDVNGDVYVADRIGENPIFNFGK